MSVPVEYTEAEKAVIERIKRAQVIARELPSYALVPANAVDTVLRELHRYEMEQIAAFQLNVLENIQVTINNK